MSWDILIFNSKEPFDLEHGKLPDFASRKIVVDQIKTTFPDVDFTDDAWGVLDNRMASIEFNIGDSENIGSSFMLHVRGSEDPVGEILRMCNDHGWIAYDFSGQPLTDEDQSGQNSFDEWQAYRDHVINGKAKPWWKFW